MATIVFNAMDGSNVEIYRLHSDVKLIEDKNTEFKQHCVFTEEYVKKSQEKALKPLSNAVNAFLNTEGGLLYCGITDDGVVKGLNFTYNQKLHFRMAFEDMMNRYTPPISKDMYSVRFVPVLYPDEVQYQPDVSHVNTIKLDTQHMLRTRESCWCDLEAKAGKENGIVSPLYVVQIRVSSGKQYFANERGDLYTRGQGSNLRMEREMGLESETLENLERMRV